jgi:hypothetical protein
MGADPAHPGMCPNTFHVPVGPLDKGESDYNLCYVHTVVTRFVDKTTWVHPGLAGAQNPNIVAALKVTFRAVTTLNSWLPCMCRGVGTPGSRLARAAPARTHLRSRSTSTAVRPRRHWGHPWSCKMSIPDKGGIVPVHLPRAASGGRTRSESEAPLTRTQNRLIGVLSVQLTG